MFKRDGKRLSKREMLALLDEREKEIQDLKRNIEELNFKLNNKNIAIENAGSIAEASIAVNGVFESAQMACDQYIDNIVQLNDKQLSLSARLEKESKEEALRIINDARTEALEIISKAKQEALDLEKETKEKCEEVLLKIRVESKNSWEELGEKIDQIIVEED